MLQQITHLRYELETRSKLLGRRDTISSEYEIKKQTIQNCIYGVDIDLGAVEIAKLRLWLSLVVDYELEDIEPLPNLDYKIMQGNSLLEELVLGDTTIKLYDRQTIQKAVNSKRMKNLFDEDPQMAMFDDIKKDQALKNMKALQVKYFSQSDANEKKKIKKQIEKIEHNLIEVSVRAETDKLSAQRLNIKAIPGIGLLPEDAKRLMSISSKESQIMAVLDELEKTGTKPFFLWRLYFADVFEEKAGFDIVIANPPYISFQEIEKNIKDIYKSSYESARGKYDIYLLFIERALSIVKNLGFMCFIVPNKFIRSNYGTGIKNLILQNKIVEIVDFNDIQIFDSVTNYTCITFIQKLNNETDHLFQYKNVNSIQNSEMEWIKYEVNQSSLSNDIWILGSTDESKLVSKIKTNRVPLGDISLSITQGIRTGGLKVFYENISPDFIEKNQIEDEVVLPILHGKNTKRYSYSLKSNDLLFFPYQRDHKTPIDINNFPKAKKYLEKYKEELLNRKDSGKVFRNTNKFWYEYWDPKPISFSHPKIVFPDISNHNQFSLDLEGYGYLNTCYGIFLKDPRRYKSILAILNSRLIEFFIKKISPSVRGGFYRYKTNYLKQIPIPELDNKKTLLEKLVDSILEISKALNNNPDFKDKKIQQLTELEREIDLIVYEQYRLTDDEIRIVEGKI